MLITNNDVTDSEKMSIWQSYHWTGAVDLTVLDALSDKAVTETTFFVDFDLN